MCATCSFSAAPKPTTASLMARGAYSNTGTAVGTAHSAAPRAWPSFRALSTLRLTNTRSMATSSGRCFSISSCTPSKMHAQPLAQRAVPGRDAAVRQLRALRPAAVDDAEARAPRAWVEAEDAHVRDGDHAHGRDAGAACAVPAVCPSA